MNPGKPVAAAGYRPDVDGLRAVAVLSVIGYHAGLPWLSGGYLGVDVFFVISGFLITRLIVRESAAGHFGLGSFFERRIRRLLPALAVVLLACLWPAWRWMLPAPLADFGRSLLAVMGLVPNLYFWRSTGYFNAAADDHPLLHTWSLGVEEQFYIGYAVLLVLLWRHARRHTTLSLVLLFVTSLVLCELTRRQAGVAAFYLLPFRAWELMLGALAARLADHLDTGLVTRNAHWMRGLLCASGMLVLVGCLVALGEATPHPGLWTLLPTGATAAVLLAGGTDHPAGRLLGWRPVVAIGLVSYSAYLWHYPLFAFTELARLRPPGAWESVGLAGLTLALAGLSWRWVEQPARRHGMPFRRVLAGLVLAAGLVAGFAVLVIQQEGAPERLPASARVLLAEGDTRNPRQLECLSRSDHPLTPAQACSLGAPQAGPSLVLLGDSHADALFVALDDQLRRSGRAGLMMAHSGCAPTPGLRRVDMGPRSPCEAYFAAAFDELARRPELRTVVLSARWSTYAQDRRFDNGEGGRDPAPSMPLDTLSSTAPAPESRARVDRVVSAYVAGIRSLRAMGKQVVLVYPVPEVGWHVPHRLALMQMRGQPEASPLSTASWRYEQRHGPVIQAFDHWVQSDPGSLAVRTGMLFCGAGPTGRCLAQDAGTPLYYDDNHLNRQGAQRVVSAMAQWLAHGGSTPEAPVASPAAGLSGPAPR